MSTEVAEMLRKIESWPAADQIELVHEVWERLNEPPSSAELDPDLIAMLQSRLDDHAANPNDTVSADEVHQYLRRQR